MMRLAFSVMVLFVCATVAEMASAQEARFSGACRHWIVEPLARSPAEEAFCEALEIGVVALTDNLPNIGLENLSKAREVLKGIAGTEDYGTATDELEVAIAIAYSLNDRKREALDILEGFRTAASQDVTSFARAYLYARLGYYTKAQKLLAGAKRTLPRAWCREDGLALDAFARNEPYISVGNTADWDERHHLPSWFSSASSRCQVPTGPLRKITLPPDRTMPVHFQASTAEVLSQGDMARANNAMLTQLARIVERFPTTSFDVVGYTDEACFEDMRSCEQGNLDLSWERAAAVKRALVALGSPSNRLRVVHHGTNGIPFPNGQRKPDPRNRIIDFIQTRKDEEFATAECPWVIELHDPVLERQNGSGVQVEPVWLRPTSVLPNAIQATSPPSIAAVKPTISPRIVNAGAGIRIRYVQKRSKVPYLYVQDNSADSNVMARSGFESADAGALVQQTGGWLPSDPKALIKLPQGRILVVDLVGASHPLSAPPSRLALGVYQEAQNLLSTPRAVFRPSLTKKNEPDKAQPLKKEEISTIVLPPVQQPDAQSMPEAPMEGNIVRCMISFRAADTQ